MQSLILSAAVVPGVSGLIGLLVWCAVAALVIWGIIALIKWSGIPIPQPVYILLTVFIGIGLILLIARFFGAISP